MTIETSTSFEETALLEQRANVGDLLDAAARDETREVSRWQFQSGVLGTRQYAYNDPSEEVREIDQNFAAGSIHDHPNFRWTSGLAELGFVVNGQYLRVRHTDYKHARVTAVTAGGRADYLARDTVEPPEVPADVLAKPTGLNADGTLDLVGDTQARWMSEIPANPDRMRADFVFLEVWLEAVDGNGAGSDAAESDRHVDIASTMLETLELNTRLSATGAKDRFENLANRPFGTDVFDAGDGTPTAQNWVVSYRFNTIPVGDCGPITGTPTVPSLLVGPADPNFHSHEFDAPLTQAQFDDLRSGAVAFVDLTSSDVGHSHTYRITWDGSNLVGEDLNPSHQHAVVITQGFPGHVPFDEAKARDGVVDDTNRFRMVRDLDMMDRFGADLESLAGSRHARYEYADLEQAMKQCFGLEGDGAVLQESYVFRDVEYFLNDPDDPTADAATPSLNAARYNRRSVMIGEADAAGRQTMDRGFNDPQLFAALTTHPEVVNGVSWAVPFEVVMRSPLESWNPAGVVETDRHDTNPEAGTQADPWTEVFNSNMYFTPVAIWSGSLTGADPADTATGTKWVRGSDGVAYEMTASGVWVRDLNGTRTRWPVFRNAQEGSMESVSLHIFRKRLVPLLAKIISGTATGDDLAWLADFASPNAQIGGIAPAPAPTSIHGAFAGLVEPGDQTGTQVVATAATVTRFAVAGDVTGAGDAVFELVNETNAFPSNPTVTLNAAAGGVATVSGLAAPIVAGDRIRTRRSDADTSTTVADCSIAVTLELGA